MLEMLMSRRSIRKFKDMEVEKEKLDRILMAGLLAPSSRSRRPWEFVVVKDKQMLKDLSMCREHSSKFLSGATAGIVIAADSEKCDVWVEDASIAASYIQLAAHSEGLGSCWIQVRNRYTPDNKSAQDYIKNLLSIPESFNVECIIALGYPDEEKKAYTEADLPFDKIHYEKY